LLHCRQTSVEENITANNSGTFYIQIYKQANLSNIGTIINDSGQVLVDSYAKEKAFNAYFSPV